MLSESETATVAKAATGKRLNFRRAVDLMCKYCIYDPVAGAGTWRQQVEACTAPHCPLYSVRPRSKGEKAQEGPSEGAGMPWD